MSSTCQLKETYILWHTYMRTHALTHTHTHTCTNTHTHIVLRRPKKFQFQFRSGLGFS